MAASSFAAFINDLKKILSRWQRNPAYNTNNPGCSLKSHWTRWESAEYLQEALDKQSRVIFERRVGSTEARALPLGGGEEEAESPHDLTRNSSRILTVSTRLENFQKVTKQRNCPQLWVLNWDLLCFLRDWSLLPWNNHWINVCLFPGKAWWDWSEQMGEWGRINPHRLEPSQKHKIRMENEYENKCCGKHVPVPIRRVKYLP